MSRLLSLLLIPLLLLPLGACNDTRQTGASAPAATPAASPATLVLDVYKSPSCGCCGEWMAHLDQAGFTTRGHHPEDLDGFKTQRQVPESLRSCHTAVSANGYVFEGHVPARFIHQFLQAPPPGAIGLSVPGMPIGSPGMETGGEFTPYTVMVLRNDGSSGVYASVASYEDQF